MLNKKTIIALWFSCFIILVSCQNKTADPTTDAKEEVKTEKTKAVTKQKKAASTKKAQTITLSKKEVKKVIGTKTFKKYDAVTKKFNNEKKALLKNKKWTGSKNINTRNDWLSRREVAIISAIGADNYAKIVKK